MTGAPSTAMPSTAALVALLERQRSEPPRVTYLHIPFGDGLYRFALDRVHVAELERTCGHTDRDGIVKPLGIGAIYGRLARGRSFINDRDPDWSAVGAAEALACEIVERDCLEIIRLGLIGGGACMTDGERRRVTPVRAKELLDLYVIGQPLETAWTYAFAILSARMVGVAPNGFPGDGDTDGAGEEAAA